MTAIATATTSTALNTDQYELTMLASAIADGTVNKRATFEVFARSLRGQPYGVFAGLGRVLDAIEQFRFDPDDVAWLLESGIIDRPTADYLSGFRFAGTIRAVREGTNYLPFMPVLTVDGTFGEAVLLETVMLSSVNHDSAVATKAARIVDVANGKPLMEMGSRRTDADAAVAAARATYIAGFAATSNLKAGRQYGIPTKGTAAHAWTLAHPTVDGEAAAFRAQMETLGVDTTLLVDTYDIPTGVRTAVSVANGFGANGPGAIRIDSGDLYDESVAARVLLDRLGATTTRIVVSGDMDERSIADLESRGAPIDGYGVGTKVVSGLTAPGFVYKLVAIETDGGEMAPVEKRAEGKRTVGGRKDVLAVRDGRGSVTAVHIVPEGFAADVPADATVENCPVVVDGLRLCAATAADVRRDRTSLVATVDESVSVPVCRYGL